MSTLSHLSVYLPTYLCTFFLFTHCVATPRLFVSMSLDKEDVNLQWNVIQLQTRSCVICNSMEEAEDIMLSKIFLH